MTYRFHLLVALSGTLCGVAAGAQSPGPAPAPAPVQAPAAAPAQQDSATVLPPVVTRADGLMAEINRRIADSATLARMDSRERYLRLKEDNRYLERVLDEQDDRIAILEKRLARLKAEREKRTLP